MEVLTRIVLGNGRFSVYLEVKTLFTDMTIYDHAIDAQLNRFLDSAPRCRLVVIQHKSDSEENKALNLGMALVEKIESLNKCDTISFQFEVENTLIDIIRKSAFIDDVYGKTIVLENFGILFEPQLQINVVDFFKRISQSMLTILLWPGEIRIDKLFFLTPSSNLIIKQNEINYFII